MGETIAICQQKGGVGKSSTAVTLAYGLQGRGKKVLLIDTDPQCNASDNCRALQTEATLYNVFTGTPAREAIQCANFMDIIPGSIEMSAADMQFTKQGREYILKKALEPLQKAYDYIVIDTPPALGIITINALTAADKVIIPMQADRYSMQGIRQLSDTITTVREYSNPELKMAGILLTRYNHRTILARDVAVAVNDAAKVMGTFVYRKAIRQGVAMQEAQAMQESIFSYAPTSGVAEDYQAFIDEFLAVET